jgi:uncharacterized protein (TIGR02466 family)
VPTASDKNTQGLIMNYHQLWPTYFLEEINPQHLQLEKELRRYIYEFDRKTGQSDRGRALKKNISEPPFDFLETALAECKAFKKLMAWITSRIKPFIREVNRGSIGRHQKWQIHYHESWYHITKSGGFHGPHLHSNTSWGWIYYFDDLEADKVGGSNKFYNPLCQHVTYVDTGIVFMERLDWAFFEVTPRAGKLLVYPGWLLHDAQPYAGSADRIILSGNTQILTET